MNAKSERSPKPGVDLHELELAVALIALELDHRWPVPAEFAEERHSIFSELGVRNRPAKDARTAGVRVTPYSSVLERRDRLAVIEDGEESIFGAAWDMFLHERYMTHSGPNGLKVRFDSHLAELHVGIGSSVVLRQNRVPRLDHIFAVPGVPLVEEPRLRYGNTDRRRDIEQLASVPHFLERVERHPGRRDVIPELSPVFRENEDIRFSNRNDRPNPRLFRQCEQRLLVSLQIIVWGRHEDRFVAVLRPKRRRSLDFGGGDRPNTLLPERADTRDATTSRNSRDHDGIPRTVSRIYVAKRCSPRFDSGSDYDCRN